MIKNIFTLVMVLAIIYAAIGILIFFATAAMSTVTGHTPDWRGAAIAALTWPFWCVRAIWWAIFGREDGSS